MGLICDIHIGDALEVGRTLPTGSVHCMVTSPPYWGLRDYGIEGQLGLEKTPEEYVERLVGILHEYRRVVRNDGTLWLNIGDCYAGSWGGYGAREGNQRSRISEVYHRPAYEDTGRRPPTSYVTRASGRRDRAEIPAFPLSGDGLKPKDLVGIPWMVAFALRADGWWLRSAVIWHKPNCMPESVNGWRWERHKVKVKGEWIDCPGCEKCKANDGLILKKGSWRLTNDYEYVLLFSKAMKYFADADAIREPAVRPGDIQTFGGSKGRAYKPTQDDPNYRGGKEQWGRTVQTGLNGRNKRAVWTIPTEPSSEPHFAMFPLELPETCILAGTSDKGCCPECGAPWVRVVEKSRTFESGSGKAGNIPQGKHPDGLQGGGETQDVRRVPCVQVKTTDWRPSCECNAGAPVPCTVLDMFSGMGNTGRAAFKHNRNYKGVELNPKYAEKSKVLIQGPLFSESSHGSTGGGISD